MVLPNTALRQALTVADHPPRRDGEGIEEEIDREILGRVTISVGVSMPKPGDDTDALIERADAPSAAKRNGRNRVICESTRNTPPRATARWRRFPRRPKPATASWRPGASCASRTGMGVRTLVRAAIPSSRRARLLRMTTFSALPSSSFLTAAFVFAAGFFFPSAACAAPRAVLPPGPPSPSLSDPPDRHTSRPATANRRRP